tara:strand:- start:687 stop:1850 length:1164 start_codon:yes stop_codon:yes gene_type:complete
MTQLFQRPLQRAVIGTLASVAVLFGLAGSFSAAAETKSREAWKKEYQRPSEVPYPDDNLYTKEKADLGKKLFFDPRLSGADYISCATCHNPSFAWGDGLPTGFGNAMTKLGRRTPTILNTAYGELMMWDGRFESLEEQALGPMAAPAEMNQEMEAIADELRAIPGYRTLFNVAFPGEGLSIDNIAKAIATFERTVISGTAPFDLWIAGEETAISEAAKRGFDLFNGKANCVACHSGWNFTDDSFHDIGIDDDDLGRGEHFKDNVKMQHAFKTPTLRNAVERAPYMHNGTQVTLSDVVAHYNTGGVVRPSLSDEMRPLQLSQQEQDDLVAFMATLSSVDERIAMPLLPPNDQGPAAGLRQTSPAAGPADVAPIDTKCRVARLHLRPCR